MSSTSASREEISLNWGDHFSEIHAALAIEKSGGKPYERLEDLTDEQKLVRMQEIMNLKDLALEGMTSKLVKANEELHAIQSRYFFSLFMNIKLTARELPKNSDLTGEQLFSMCIEAEVPVDNWPKFISTHYFKNI